MRNRKGFTLIELLAVIVRLAILLAIALPMVTKYISNSKRDSLVTTAREFADTVEKDATSELFDLPIASNDVTIVSLDQVKLQKGGSKSPFNGKWVYDSSYVAIVNVGTEIDPLYKYYVTLTDTKRYTIPLLETEKISTKKIVRNNASRTKAVVTPLCGSEDGEYMVVNKIAGLESFKNTNWNATVYSSNGC